MIFNLIILFFVVCYGVIYKKGNIKSCGRYVLICTIMLILIAGLRHFTVGVDCKTYVDWFYRSIGDSYAQCFKAIEPFYYVFQTFLANQFQDYTAFFFAIAIILYSIIGYLIYQYSKNPLTSFLMLLGMGYYFFSMTGLRQTMGLAFLLVSLLFILRKKYLWSILFIIVASQFHITSVVYFAIFPVLLIKPNKIKYFIIVECALSIIMLLFHGSLIRFFAALLWESGKYAEEEAVGGYTTLFLLITIGVYCLSLLKSSKAKMAVSTKELYMNDVLLKVFLLGIPFQVMTLYSANVFRLAMLFHISSILLLPNAISSISNPSIRRISYITANAIFIIEFILFTSKGSGILPYHFYWEYV